MQSRDDTRAQSVVIGSLFVFTLLVLSFSAYQAVSVPNQNAQVEIDHFQEAEDQFSELRSSVVNAIDSDDERSTVFDLGPRYPSRIAALNPPPAAGRLETTSAGRVEFESASVCSKPGETATTRSLVYTPSYNEYRESQAVSYESRVIAREYEEGTIYQQRFVRGDDIDLVLLNGTVSENGLDSYSLDLDGSKRHTTELTDPSITVPSRFEALTWNDEILDGQSGVTATDGPGDRVTLDFTGGYDVSCAVVGLDRAPGFTPPDSGGGGGSGGSGGAYDIEWRDPSSEPGTSSCSATDCTLDASTSQTLDLTAATVPTAQDATVSFSVSDSDVGTGWPSTSDTGSDGKASTTLRARSDGSFKIYASSGGAGDVLNVTVVNCPPGCGVGVTVVYTNSNQKISTATQSAGTTDLAQDARAIGPLTADIDGDGTDEIPYVQKGGSNDRQVSVVEPDGSDESLLSSTRANGAKSLLGVGRWDGHSLSVYFADEDQSTIYRTNPTEGDVEVVDPTNGVDAVAGPADIDDDGSKELVYADSSQVLRYFEPGVSGPSATGTKIPVTNGVGSDDGIGLGRPADFDGDGTARVPVADGSNRLVLLDSDGNEEVLVDSGVAKSPVAAVDWDDDGELEVMYLTGSEELRYVDDVAGSPTVENPSISAPRDETGVT